MELGIKPSGDVQPLYHLFERMSKIGWDAFRLSTAQKGLHLLQEFYQHLQDSSQTCKIFRKTCKMCGCAWTTWTPISHGKASVFKCHFSAKLEKAHRACSATSIHSTLLMHFRDGRVNFFIFCQICIFHFFG